MKATSKGPHEIARIAAHFSPQTTLLVAVA